VGKRIGNSVKRNLVKRRLKASLKNLLPSSNWVLVVRAHPPIVDVEFQTIETELNDLLVGAGVVFEGDI
jgi:ribonuclease P protein component